MGSNLLIARSTLLVAFIACAVLPSTLQAESADAIKIEFIGNEIIPSSVLKSELQSNPDYFFDAYNGKPIEELMPLSERLITAGYKNSGFPNATAKVTNNANTLKIEISEGKRYRNGSVIVTGVDKAWNYRIVEQLTRGGPKGEVFPTFINFNGETKISWKNPDGKDADLTDPLWEVGAVTSFTNSDKLLEKVLGSVRTLASSEVELTSSVVLTDDGNAELHVDVTSMGKPRLANEIHFSGAYERQKKDILELVHLQPGDGVDANKICEMTRALWESGRFKKYHIHWDSWHGDTLCFDIELMPGVPWLDEPLDDKAQTMLNFVHWLSELNERGDDIRVDSINTILIISPTGAYFHKRLARPENSEDAEEVLIRAIVDQEGFSINHSALQDRLLLPHFKNKLYLSLSAGVVPPLAYSLPAQEDSEDRLFSGGVGCSTNSGNALDKHVNFKLAIDPAEFLTLPFRNDCSFELENENFTIARGGTKLVLEKLTGKLVCYQDPEFRIQIDRGLFTEIKSEFDKKSNALDLQHPVQSLLEAISQPEYWQAIEGLSQKSLNPNYRTLVSKTAKLEMFKVLNEWFSSQFDKDKTFTIPVDTVASQNFLSKSLAGLALEIGSHFPQDSWPTKIAAAEVMIACGRNRDATKIIDEIVADPLSGPLCLGVLAACLNQNSDSRTNAVAALGEKRLVPDDIYRDLQWLSSFVPAAVQASVVQFTSSLTAEEIDALIELSHNKSAETFLTACRNSDPNLPVLQNAATLIAEGGYFKEKLNELSQKQFDTKVPEDWERFTKFNQDRKDKDKKDTKQPDNSFPKIPWN